MPGAGRAQGGRALRAPAAEEALPGWLMPRAGAWGQRGFCTPQHEAALLKHAKMDFPIPPQGCGEHVRVAKESAESFSPPCQSQLKAGAREQ